MTAVPPPHVARDAFALASGTLPLNHGSYGATPRAVLAAQDRWRARMEANPDAFFRRDLPGLLRAALSEAALRLKADPADLAFTTNATEAINAVLRGLSFAPGDEILTTGHVYNAVRQTLRHVAGLTGARVIEAPLPLPAADAASLAQAVTARIGPRTRLVVLDQITSPSALSLPLDRIIPAARAAGARILIDGAHAPGQIALDVPALGADWWTGNAHKWWFAAKGCALFWARREVQDSLHPLALSHGYGQGFAAEFDWTGTRDPSAWLSLPDAIAAHDGFGGPALMTRNAALASEAADLLCDATGAIALAAPDLRCAMAALRLPVRDGSGAAAARVMAALAEQGIEAPVAYFEGFVQLRISAQVYNARGDYVRLADTLRALL